MTTSHSEQRAASLAAVEEREARNRLLRAEQDANAKPPREVEVNLRTKDGFRMKYGASFKEGKR